ncbi:M20/M25/M40 family metallo-hydrolase [Hansschlegelia zhihuaiae]|uniref:M20/M25/M40 family metallo-hydrolase n=1 Tax=Hansschlegelia zhihuaiae TaxID=405005 RepID=A0A4Q0ML20_9HYPH|nr:M20/M25/M40 family metallo-hydrolase [Hansschlegelia zhihuaiae]RXF74173.1 M20/M25/M40 family metallo-hydrolase [Hansschlegelia zhihuaiae]
MTLGPDAFDTEEMLAGLRRWVECESPTFEPQAVNAMMDLASEDLAAAGADITRIPGPPGLGDCVLGTFPHTRAGEPGVLVMGHLDTVHALGTLERLPFRREGERAYGPGILDMKGGTYAAIEAIAALARASVETPLPVRVLLTSDEEIGSPGCRAIIEAKAAESRYVLVPEPGLPGDGVVTGRYAIARFDLEATGQSSHAGADLKRGRSAIAEMARRIGEIEAMTDEDCTFSVGVVHGGRWVNCVASSCRGEALSMAKRQADLDRGVERMLALTNVSPDGSGFRVTRGVTRPVWEPSAETMRMYELARDVAAGLGVDLSHGAQGAGSDANFTGAMGVASLDGLGVLGEGWHTLEEHILIDSLPRRARMMTGLLTRLA